MCDVTDCTAWVEEENKNSPTVVRSFYHSFIHSFSCLYVHWEHLIFIYTTETDMSITNN